MSERYRPTLMYLNLLMPAVGVTEGRICELEDGIIVETLADIVD